MRGVGLAGGDLCQSTKGPEVGSVLELLERREAAALVRVEEARTHALAAADRLDAACVELSNLVIARLTVAESTAVAVEGGETVLAIAGGGPRPGVRGAARDEAVYSRISEIFNKAAGPLRVKQVCEGLGLPPGRNATESVRSKLRRLADDGVLDRVEDGLFTLASTVVR
ncbi:hypothetical protein ABIA31_003578 [Catenulispora sp. MAP5-51]